MQVFTKDAVFHHASSVSTGETITQALAARSLPHDFA